MSKVTVNGKDYPVRFGHRQMVIFEERNNRGMDGADIIGKRKDLFEFYYCAILAGCARAGVECDITLDEVIDACDDDTELFNTFIKINEEASQPKKQ